MVDFWLSIEQHIHENIKFADSKAVQVIAIDTALIGALYAVTDQRPEAWRVAALLVAALLGAGILFAVSVIRPRGEQNKARGAGYVDAIRIAQFDETSFLSGASRVSEEALLTELRLFVYDRACIDKAKYDQLRWAIAVSVVAWVLAFAFVAAIRLSPMPPDASIERTTSGKPDVAAHVGRWALPTRFTA